ncbi:MAG: flavodoxin family protein [Pyrinomonadaceae bacterium]
MKALILLGTLKKEGLSNTATLSEFLTEKMNERGIDCETVRLVEHRILPGTFSDMGSGDDWPAILKKIIKADIIVFATPVWWGGHSSEIQRVIERLDELHDEILKGKKSRLKGKTGGIVITGDSDGAQHIIGNIGNFFNAVGLLFPPFTTLSVLWEGQAKDKKPSKSPLKERYKKDYSKDADRMIDQLVKYIEKGSKV